MKTNQAFFFAVSVLVSFSFAIPAYAEEPLATIRFQDRMVKHFEGGVVRETFGMQPYVLDGKDWVDRIIANNGTHFNVYSEMGSFSFDKNDCTITQYAQGFDPTSNAAGQDDIVIGDWFWTIARKNGASPWEVIDPMMFGCTINTFQNSTGKYLEMTRSHSSGSYLKVTIAAPEGKPVEDFAELYMNVPAWNGNKFAFVLWAKDVKTDSLTFRNGTTVQIPDGSTIIDRSQLTVNSLDFVKDGNAFYFDWKKAAAQFKTLLLNKTTQLDVQFGFNNNPVTLNTGQKMFLDPTYGYTNGTQITARTTTGAGVACPGAPYDTSTENMVGLPDSGTAGRCRRVLEQWDVTTIPDGVTVTSILVRYDVTSFPNTRNCSFYSIENKPSTSSAATNYADAGDGTAFVTNNSTCTTVANDKVQVMPSTAYTDLEDNLVDNWWAVGIVFTNQVRDGTQYEMTLGPNIELQVMYVAGPPGAITDLAADDYDADSVDLTFTAPSFAGGTLQNYVFNYTTPCGEPLTPLPNGTTATTYTVSGLTAATCYSFRASAATEAGFNGDGNILNVTTLAFNQANFTVGDLSFDAVNQDVISIFFERDDISATSLYLNVTYPDTWELACDFKYKFAMTNHTYKNLSFVTIDSDEIESSFQFNNVDREIINVLCWDQNGTGGEGRYLITQTSFPFLRYIQNFDDGQYGTSGDFGAFDLIYLAVVIVSLVGLNRTNESVGAGFMIVITAAMAYFEFITIPTAAISGIGLVVMLIIITTRKD